MKIIVTTAALATFLAVDSRADLAYSAPGMFLAKKVTGQSISETEDLGMYWKYTVEGIKWQLVAATPLDGFVATNGNLLGSNGNSSFQGQSHLSITVNGTNVVAGETLYCGKIGESRSEDVDFTTPIVFHSNDKVNISVNFEQSTNMTGDSESYAVVKGKGLKEPPGPEGEINAVLGSDDHCLVSWKISRSEGIYRTIELDVVPVVFTTVSRDNKGHGNNEDSVDSNNTGNACSAWLDSGKITQAIADDNVMLTEDLDEGRRK
ncbi:hypothetical protein [Rubritalea profundi]|uniref:Uncharacterized protein n=1 Tax=Rubritalea profundi TaxID=1658618 RepID=A0A2S7U062_9BACT|nr:hypothetical protein [Rubritalea profundi]PQJ27970.1 hypothetical protein BSZ32_05280 [Rubritalea profundi]